MPDERHGDPAHQPRPARPGGARGSRWHNRGWVLLFLAPSAVPLLLFTIVPMLGSVWVSLHVWNLISPMRWVGLENYLEPRSRTRRPARVFANTLIYCVGYLPLVYVGGLGLALVAQPAAARVAACSGRRLLPARSSRAGSSSPCVWKWLLNPTNGLVNTVLGRRRAAAAGAGGPTPPGRCPSVILSSAWKDLGFVMVILLAGLQAIPPDVLEAAWVDGAGAWQRFWRVTLPLLSPSTFFVVVISLINGFQVFDQVYVMTGGGPSGLQPGRRRTDLRPHLPLRAGR